MSIIESIRKVPVIAIDREKRLPSTEFMFSDDEIKELIDTAAKPSFLGANSKEYIRGMLEHYNLVAEVLVRQEHISAADAARFIKPVVEHTLLTDRLFSLLTTEDNTAWASKMSALIGAALRATIKPDGIVTQPAQIKEYDDDMDATRGYHECSAETARGFDLWVYKPKPPWRSWKKLSPLFHGEDHAEAEHKLATALRHDVFVVDLMLNRRKPLPLLPPPKGIGIKGGISFIDLEHGPGGVYRRKSPHPV